jgi:hypothetical protein
MNPVLNVIDASTSGAPTHAVYIHHAWVIAKFTTFTKWHNIYFNAIICKSCPNTLWVNHFHITHY